MVVQMLSENSYSDADIVHEPGPDSAVWLSRRVAEQYRDTGKNDKMYERCG